MSGVNHESQRQMSKLDVWLAAELGLRGHLRHDPIAGGRSNVTVLVTDEDDRRVVLRQPPRAVTGGGAHDVLLEAQIMTGLRFTGVPVPHVLGVCEDAAVVGMPFYAMDYVEGEVLDTPDAAQGYDDQGRRGLGFELIDVLAAVQKVPPAAVGLTPDATPFLARQCRRWIAQWQNMNRDLPAITHVHRRLQAISARLEPQPECLMHGDLRFGNVIVADRPDRPRIAAVLDWELSTVGHPLADLAWIGARMQAPGGGLRIRPGHVLGAGLSGVRRTRRALRLCHRRVDGQSRALDRLSGLAWVILAAGIQARRGASAPNSQMREGERWHGRRVELLADFAADLVP